MGAVEELKLKMPSITDVARESLKSAGGDQQKAVEFMARRVRGDTELYRELMDGLLQEACCEAVGKLLRDMRAAVWPQNYDAGGNGHRVKALAAGNALMFFPLPGGKLLGQSTRQEIEEAAAFYQRQASDMGHKARWLALVAKNVDGKKTVATCLTEQALQKLQEKAANE